MTNFKLSNALTALRMQGVIAYPTESVFGLGCDPDCEIAIQHILDLKQRPAHKGLILIAANIEQLKTYADFSSLNETQLTAIKNTWPGPFTWVVPVQKTLSKLISGDFDSVAVRVSDHPVVQQLCSEFGKPIISTSANLSGLDACVNASQVKEMFINNPLLTTIIEAEVSGLDNPSQIHHALTGQRLR
ncbi:L-threonylcarbamoyladenylate synthase [Psychromonas sp. Urea-02u-13]|uniref:L-threonylcarbamoyladenylate synthase n=1 Tax=Psychromonas sp. Urea-02u-13 TaxID=2058326 RepID=UPI000C344771|nr:L-threonylcarbamoyladenylate synthase [Psychromonas sp. Urea-02u-13]PKG39173.1 threonylcarbamoyl-AMP synthase [Psychromonas sp. Urea-02u-13]